MSQKMNIEAQKHFYDAQGFDLVALNALNDLCADNPKISNRDEIYDQLLESIEKHEIFSKLPNLKYFIETQIRLTKDYQSRPIGRHLEKTKERLPILSDCLLAWTRKMANESPNENISFKAVLLQQADSQGITRESVKELKGIEEFRETVAKALNINKKTLDDWMNNNPQAIDRIEALRPAVLTIDLSPKNLNSMERIANFLTK
jgi:hypothetical protein